MKQRREQIRNEEIAALKTYLQSQRIIMSKEGLQKYLRQITEIGDRSVAKKLIGQLGSPRYRVRAEAQQSLMKLKEIPLDLLREASKNSLEERLRVEKILNNYIPRQRLIVKKVIRAIELLDASGLTKEIFTAVSKFQDEKSVVRSAKQAMSVVVTKEDVSYLSSQMKPGTAAPLQEISIPALRRLEDPRLADGFMQWSRDAKLGEEVRLESALALVDVGDRRAMNLLVGFMTDAESQKVRARSQLALRRFTGQSLPYSASADDRTRAKQVDAYKTWIAANARTAKLNFPLRLVRSPLEGLTLVAMWGSKKVALYDRDLNEVWSYGCKYPRAAVKLPNGNILIAQHLPNRIIEVNLDKKIVRIIPVNTNNVVPLENGNLLVGGHFVGGNSGRNRVDFAAEITLEGKTVRKIGGGVQGRGRICNAVPLENGNTIVLRQRTSGFDLLEYNLENKLVWSCVASKGSAVETVQALENGNILCTVMGGTAIEVNRDKEIVWQCKLAGLRSAWRTEDGNTLLMNGTQLIEVNPEGKKVKVKDGMSSGHVRR
ncbi:MAG: HEAT repeat domain-containing protein [Gemmataceae bacterium]